MVTDDELSANNPVHSSLNSASSNGNYIFLDLLDSTCRNIFQESTDHIVSGESDVFGLLHYTAVPHAAYRRFFSCDCYPGAVAIAYRVPRPEQFFHMVWLILA